VCPVLTKGKAIVPFFLCSWKRNRKRAGHTRTSDDEKRSVRADPASGCRSAASFPLLGRNEEFAILMIVGNDFPARQMDGVKLISRVSGEIRHVEPCILKSYNTSPPE
jgi:hypothetical protein